VTREELDRALSRLGGVEPSPLVAHQQLAAAKQRLAQARPHVTQLERYEPWLLWSLSGMHLIWLLSRVFFAL
jgi:hypothetical protein